MSTVAKGTKFEKTVEKVINWMYSKYENVVIAHNVLIASEDTNRQVDVLITVTIRDLIFKVAIECKDYRIKLPIGKIDEFVSKKDDIKADKGIIIASNGFSSSAISKAKRKDIILYSLTDKIEIENKELDIPVIIKEIIPFETETRITVERMNAKQMRGETLIRDPLIVNDYNIEKLLKHSWESNKVVFNLTTEFQTITIPEITRPYKCNYFINEKNNIVEKVELSNFDIKLKLKINYYVINLSELIDLKVLQNIHENKLEMFIDEVTILSSLPNARSIPKTYVDDFTGLTAVFLLKGNFNIETIEGHFDLESSKRKSNKLF
jgi:hypothetical protein